MTQTGHSTLDTYNFIVGWAIEHKGNTPSQRQVANACGFSHASAQYHVGKLIASGHLERIDGELCVTHSKFIVTNGILDKQTERVNPDILSMTAIPKDVRWLSSGNALEDFGIVAGDAIDDEFLHATYPANWKYEPHPKPVDGRMAWFLLDAEGTYRAVLRFDPNQYAATLHMLE